ncbi:MAG: FAD-binding oxidoreductase [Hydrotalea sp.]|nr:FAD-binding oxidoreductase [Hydrotalea sp.]
MQSSPRPYVINDTIEEVVKKNHAVIIIGGDTMALSIAHYLSQNHDGEDILILSPTTLGATIDNRQWAMVRANYQTGANTPFFEMNLKLWEDLHRDIGYNVMLSQIGAIELLTNDKMIKNARYRGNTMRLHGVDADYLELAELRRILPLVDFSDQASQTVLAGLAQGRAGFFNPMAAFYGFWRTLSARRVKIVQHASIKEIIFSKNGRGTSGVKITRNGTTHSIHGQKIILAMADGGARLLTNSPDHSPELKKFFAREMTAMFGKNMAAGAWPWVAATEVELLSESLSPMMDKIIQFPTTFGGIAGQDDAVAQVSIGQGELGNVWFRAFARHPLPNNLTNMEFDATTSDAFFAHLDQMDNVDNISHRATVLARAAVQLMPALLRVKLLTRWHQTYLASFDGSPIIDRLFDKNDLYMVTGINGDGYALAPAAGVAMAHLVATGTPHPSAADYGFQRFTKGQFLYERAI